MMPCDRLERLFYLIGNHDIEVFRSALKEIVRPLFAGKTTPKFYEVISG